MKPLGVSRKSESIWFVPQATLDAVQRKVADAAVAWAAAWGVSDVGDCVSSPIAQHDLLANDPTGHATQGAALTLADAQALTSRTSPMVNAYAKAVFHAETHKSPVASMVADMACQALKDTLAHHLGPATLLSPPTASQNASACPGDWGVCCTVYLFKQPLALYLPVTQLLASGLLTTPRQPELSRWHATEALDAVPVALVAELGSVEIDVADFTQLREGDVIVLTQSVSSPLRVHCQQADLQLAAQIGHVGTHRAIQVLAANKKF